MERKNFVTEKILFLGILICFYCLTVPAQTKGGTGNITVNEYSITKWDPKEGVLYKQVPGANLGATSFEIINSNLIAFLSNSGNEVVITDRTNGKAVKRFNVSYAPRDFCYSSGYFYVLLEDRVTQYDKTGNEIKAFTFPEDYRGVERLTRFNNSTYLLLPSGNSLMIEFNGRNVKPKETDGWITASGSSVITRINGYNSYSIKVITGKARSYEKVFYTSNKVAGVYVVGSTNSSVVLDVQTFISESPVSVERTVKVININDKSGLSTIAADIKIPDCYFVLSNKDMSLQKDGTIYNMVTSRQGVHIFSLTETKSQNVQGYPAVITQTKYHFNDNLIKVENVKEK